MTWMSWMSWRGLNIIILSHPCDHDIACMDAGTYDLSGTKIMTVHPEHKKAHASMGFFSTLF
jgi:hypothetical protein